MKMLQPRQNWSKRTLTTKWKVEFKVVKCKEIIFHCPNHTVRHFPAVHLNHYQGDNHTNPWLNHLRMDSDFCHKGCDTEIAHNFLMTIRKALWGALSDGSISFSIQPFSGEKSIFWIFLKPSVVNARWAVNIKALMKNISHKLLSSVIHF
jgi:Pyruvate/2-oxoacid:ferredoxin oxidoreductase delta subunit